MIIKNLLANNGDTDAIYISILNAEGATLNRGEIVEWDTDATGDNIGKSVEEVDSSTPQHVAGVVQNPTIADGVYGLIQVYGLHDAVLTVTTATVALAVSATVESSVGKANDHSASTDLAANANHGIFGSVVAVVDTNSAQIFLRIM